MLRKLDFRLLSNRLFDSTGLRDSCEFFRGSFTRSSEFGFSWSRIELPIPDRDSLFWCCWFDTSLALLIDDFLSESWPVL